MLCPKCASPTEVTAYDEIRVDRCTNCKGLWFDSGELESLRKDTWMADYILDTGDAKVGKKFNRVDKVSCPRCGQEMNEEADADQGHIIYESCPQGHGTFLDAGEFTDLLHKTFWDRFKRLV